LKLQIIPFRVRHLDVIKPDVTPEQKGMMSSNAGKYAFTGCLLGDPVGCAGVMIDDENIGWGWSFFTPLLKTAVKIQLLRTVRRLIDEVIIESGVKEIRVIVEPTDAKAVQFAAWLGFDTKAPKHMYTRRINGSPCSDGVSHIVSV